MVFALSFGAFILPTAAEAGFFSSFFGNEADASADPVISNGSPVDTAPQPTAFQPTVSPNSFIAEKDSTDKDGVDPNSTVRVDNAGSSLVPNVGTGVDDTTGTDSDQISVYVVRQGDSISQIAGMFGVSVNTILWANDMKKGEKLTPGDVLFILPVSGIEHTVAKGQTLQSIAKLYKADVRDIAGYNGIAENAKLAVGDQLIIPDGTKAEENDKPVQNLGASIAKDNQYYQAHPTKNLSGYYINPVPGARKSQGIHDKNAVDLAISNGTPIHAAAAGRVSLARNGYNGGFGNLVIIDHPNGTQTLYAHQSRIATSTGAQVSQGQTIGYVGSTGRSTGPHLHFEVHGARNPGADGSWAH